MSGGGSVAKTITKGVQAIGSYYGFDDKGNFNPLKNGPLHWADEGIGEITGRNQSRAALHLAENQYNDAQKQAQELITQQQWNKQQSDLNASSNAAAANASAAARSGANYSNATPLGLGSGFNAAANSGKDFLGL